MKVTGIVKRIDDLGRISIPRTVMEQLLLKEGDLLEFYIEDNDIILRKYNINLLDNIKKLKEIIKDVDIDSIYQKKLLKKVEEMEEILQ